MMALLMWWLQIQEAERRQQLLVDILRKENQHRDRLVCIRVCGITFTDC